ncbi:unnamed protein product [Cyclocybe aegerita]|uniref:Uncharacterized protein n=1 Tax=Cyclocybe aegerita TaxID=1973307 RepID=A0A8S0VXS5_CYCAE|nr:unnamed protein product [Cyclocybe aegerita]
MQQRAAVGNMGSSVFPRVLWVDLFGHIFVHNHILCRDVYENRVTLFVKIFSDIHDCTIPRVLLERQAHIHHRRGGRRQRRRRIAARELEEAKVVAPFPSNTGTGSPTSSRRFRGRDRTNIPPQKKIQESGRSAPVNLSPHSSGPTSMPEQRRIMTQLEEIQNQIRRVEETVVRNSVQPGVVEGRAESPPQYVAISSANRERPLE